MMTALQAVYEHVPKMPRPEPEDPGPFSFAAQERVHRILTQAGFAAGRGVRSASNVVPGYGVNS